MGWHHHVKIPFLQVPRTHRQPVGEGAREASCPCRRAVRTIRKYVWQLLRSYKRTLKQHFKIFLHLNNLLFLMDAITSSYLPKITHALLIYGFCSNYNLDTEGMVDHFISNIVVCFILFWRILSRNLCKYFSVLRRWLLWVRF